MSDNPFIVRGPVFNAHPTLAVTDWLTFSCGLRINVATGEVVIPDGLTLPEASRAFWEGLSLYAPRRPG